MKKKAVYPNVESGVSNIGFLLKLDLDESLLIVWAFHDEHRHTVFAGFGKGTRPKKSVILQLPEMPTEILTDPMVHWG